MKRTARSLLAVLFALIAATSAAFAQAQRSYSQAELDQMLAPVALYPDPLLSQVLMAATFPNEVAEAARWTRDYPGLPGEEAVRTVQNESWDASVKSLVAFPEILQRMDEEADWTRSLGDAFLAQEPQVMDTVQQLRRRAAAAGNLQSSEQVRVEQQGESIALLPASPQAVYVPYYDPMVVYGSWWWPSYRPVRWAPWPGYARPYRPGASANFWWGRPARFSTHSASGNVDWRQRHPRFTNRGTAIERPRWQQDRPQRRVDRQPAQIQVQRAAGIQARPQPQVRTRQEVRPQAQPRPPVQARPQPQFRQERQVRREARQEQRIERGHRGSERRS